MPTPLPAVCRYKEFLDGVTPKEWFATQAAKQQVGRLTLNTLFTESPQCLVLLYTVCYQQAMVETQRSISCWHLVAADEPACSMAGT